MAKQLLELLCDGGIHTGGALGSALGISRAAVCKQVKKLNNLGLPITSNKGVGYRLLSPIELLDSAKIIAGLNKQARKLVSKVNVRWAVDSTNNDCLAHLKSESKSGYICLAECQTSGRGRRGRKWISPLCQNLYLSLSWKFSGGAESLEGFSLAVAVVVAEVLQKDFLLEGVKLKWPNDILCDDKKIGGILIDTISEIGGPCSVVVGLGINASNGSLAMSEIDQPWISMESVSGRNWSRNQLATSILNRLMPMLDSYECDRFASLQPVWIKYDAFINKPVVLQYGPADYIEGISCGVSPAGELLLNVNGSKMAFKSGEVSLRCA